MASTDNVPIMGSIKWVWRRNPNGVRDRGPGQGVRENTLEAESTWASKAGANYLFLYFSNCSKNPKSLN